MLLYIEETSKHELKYLWFDTYAHLPQATYKYGRLNLQLNLYADNDFKLKCKRVGPLAFTCVLSNRDKSIQLHHIEILSGGSLEVRSTQNLQVPFDFEIKHLDFSREFMIAFGHSRGLPSNTASKLFIYDLRCSSCHSLPKYQLNAKHLGYGANQTKNYMNSRSFSMPIDSQGESNKLLVLMPPDSSELYRIYTIGELNLLLKKASRDWLETTQVDFTFIDYQQLSLSSRPVALSTLLGSEEDNKTVEVREKFSLWRLLLFIVPCLLATMKYFIQQLARDRHRCSESRECCDRYQQDRMTEEISIHLHHSH